MSFSFTHAGAAQAVGQNISLLIQPIQTDKKYSPNQESHYVVRNDGTHLNKLLLFIGGTSSVPKNYQLICDQAATIGLDVISLSYPNQIPAASLKNSSDKFVFDAYRDEVCFGNPVSSKVDVDELNSINTRTIKLLQYLKANYPEQNWSQYLTAANELKWDKVIVAGHSQGSGHACYLGKKNLVDRVVMFAGPNDYSSHYHAAANWLTLKGKTPLSKQFALLHVRDEMVSFDTQVVNLRGLGLLGPTEAPTTVDDLEAPYLQAHALSTNVAGFSYHNAVVGRNPKFRAVWSYMFTFERKASFKTIESSP